MAEAVGLDLAGALVPRSAVLVHAVVGVDITTPGWLGDISCTRPTVIVTDGLMALLSGAAFTGMTRALTAHFTTGELAFNAYSRLAMRNSRRVRGPLSMPTAGEGIDDPHEPETWGARLTLTEEMFLGRAPEIAVFPPVLRTIARLGARSVRISRAGDRVLRYGF